MITFTKEQLIASAHARIEFAEMMLAGELEPLKERTWSIELELARIALASLEAEAVCVIDQSNLDYLKSGSDADVWPASRTEMGDVLLYRAAPPAPVSAPYLLEQFAEFMAAESIKSGDYPDGWQCKASNAAHEYAQNIRTAMLQGADGNSPVIPDGWVIVPINPTEEMNQAAFEAAGSPSDWYGFDELWEAAVAAAPQQEV